MVLLYSHFVDRFMRDYIILFCKMIETLIQQNLHLKKNIPESVKSDISGSGEVHSACIWG